MHTFGDWFPSSATIARAFGITNTIFEARQSAATVNVGDGLISLTASGGLSTGSAGGFALYPSKTNNNQLHAVWRRPRNGYGANYLENRRGSVFHPRGHRASAADVIRRANEALYRSKREGRDRLTVDSLSLVVGKEAERRLEKPPPRS